MKPLTSEWTIKAEGDYATAEREYQAEPPNYDAVAFHCQQCVEKYLKARLVEAEITFPKIHDLTAILDLTIPLEPEWNELRVGLNSLTSLGIEVRYPGTIADKQDAEEALAVAKRVR